MIARIVSFALSQRLLIVIAALLVMLAKYHFYGRYVPGNNRDI